jgi:hypothetical protein
MGAVDGFLAGLTGLLVVRNGARAGCIHFLSIGGIPSGFS